MTLKDPAKALQVTEAAVNAATHLVNDIWREKIFGYGVVVALRRQVLDVTDIREEVHRMEPSLLEGVNLSAFGPVMRRLAKEGAIERLTGENKPSDLPSQHKRDQRQWRSRLRGD